MEEFKNTLDKLRPGFTVDEVVAIANEIDEDGNGLIGKEEFEKLVQRFYPRELLTAHDTKPRSFDCTRLSCCWEKLT